MIPRRADAWEHLNVIPMAVTQCNAACAYCFEEKDPKRMSEREAERIFEALAAYAEARPELARISFYWHGGEPFLMGSEWYQRAAERCAEVFAGSGLRIQHNIQSNLLLYDSRWAPVLQQYFGGSIGSSVDAPNLFRKTVGGTPDDYARRWRERLLLARADGISVAVITLPNQSTLELGAERLCEYLFGELGLELVQVNLPFPAPPAIRASLPIAELDRGRLEAFMVELAEVWSGTWRDRGKTLNPIAAITRRLEGGREQLPCILASNCAESFLSIAPNGDVGLCDCWATSYPEMHLGNIFRDPIGALNAENMTRRRFFARSEQLLNGDCGTCPALAVCFGGCPVRAYSFTGQLDVPDPYCSIYRAMSSVASRIAQRT